jgi:nickel-type superoxide dismutase maturation protease
MLRVIKVTGDSLSPEYREGDYVVVATIPFLLNRIQAGDVIVFQQPTYGTLIKKVVQVEREGDQFLVVGAHPNSVDSRHFGPVPRQTLIGRVIWHIPKPAR